MTAEDRYGRAALRLGLLGRRERDLSARLTAAEATLSDQRTWWRGYLRPRLRSFVRRVPGLRLAVARRQSLRAIVVRSVGLTQMQRGRNKASPPLRLRKHYEPQVSIIIPVYNQLDLTLRCLSSIAALRTSKRYEVVVVDDASTDATLQTLQTVEGLIVIRNESNVGFVRTCNHGASRARGETLVFLNNDTIVEPGWLDPLCDALENEGVGIAGSKVLNPDGTIQEAGCAIFRDGSAAQYARGLPADTFSAAVARDVDYCSGVSLAIRKDLFEEIGGFDLRYSPAYYEDTDLALEVASRGFRVRYCPTSVLVHLEGMSNGKDIMNGVKRYQAINQASFSEKWSERLSSQPKRDPTIPMLPPGERWILVVDHRVPRWDEDTGSRRMREVLRLLGELGYSISFWPDDLNRKEPYASELQSEGIEVVYGPVDFVSFCAGRAGLYSAVVLSRPSVAPAYLDLCRTAFPLATLVYDTVDLVHLRLQRQGTILGQAAALEEAELWKDLELGLAVRADATLAVSDSEAAYLRSEVPSATTIVVSTIHSPKPLGAGFDDRKDLLFIGGFAHPPNGDAAEWFVNDILPLISAQLPSIHVTLLGSEPTKAVKNLAGPRVGVPGYVRDVEPFFEGARVFICPLRFGAGVKGKICHAIEHGLPVVTTSLGADGMHLVEGFSCLIGDTPPQFADAVCRLYEDSRLWLTLRVNALDVLERHFSPAVARNALADLLGEPGRTKADRFGPQPRG